MNNKKIKMSWFMSEDAKLIVRLFGDVKKVDIKQNGKMTTKKRKEIDMMMRR